MVPPPGHARGWDHARDDGPVAAVNHGGEIAGGLIGLVWVVLGVWMILVGRRRAREGVGWRAAAGTIVDKDGTTQGLFLRNPHVAYLDADGTRRVVRSGSHGDLWEPGQSVDILVDPDRPDHIVLVRGALRATPYLVIGWFIVLIGVLTLIASWMLYAWVPETGG
jgi:hypothetical protein